MKLCSHDSEDVILWSVHWLESISKFDYIYLRHLTLQLYVFADMVSELLSNLTLIQTTWRVSVWLSIKR